jgi:hypothetical protein
MAKETARSTYEEGIEVSFFSLSLSAVHGVRNLRSDSLGSSISAPARGSASHLFFLCDFNVFVDFRPRFSTVERR